MKIFKTIKAKFTREGHHPRQGGLEIFKYIGPGLLVTVGFIDPGNWASNLPQEPTTVMPCCGWSRSRRSC